MSHKLKAYFIIFLFSLCGENIFAQGFCDQPISDKTINTYFEKLALKQMALEFGQEDLVLSGTQQYPVGPDLVRVESFLKFRKPGRENLSTMRIKGWISRCRGTLIIRGNTWLQDGTLAVQRYKNSDLPGDGFVFGDKNSSVHVIAYVDSRCPECHRLIAYMRELVKDKKMYIELRQTAFLETAQEAVQDTQLQLTSKFDDSGQAISEQDYIEMLGGFNSEDKIDANTQAYKKALMMIEKNTRTARHVLYITSVPGVLVMDDKKNNAYRLTSFWEMNRLFQPDL
ncbi:MAG: thioredoxin domain-containing protein [Gammaproteobacteria bacterium]|nr:thioredoxin domain-containing protein [Gammaproteobacteria bacterium]